MVRFAAWKSTLSVVVLVHRVWIFVYTGLKGHFAVMADRKGRSVTFKVPRALNLRELKTGLESGIHHFTVVCLVAWPLDESETEVDLVLIETSPLFLC